jgi:hypothetical protein
MSASFDPVELVHVYTHRWSAQENNLRDFLLALGLDTNHGYTKCPVENSEVAKRRAVLEWKLAKIRRQAQHAREQCERAWARSRTLEKRLKQARTQAARTLSDHLQAWERAAHMALSGAREARVVPCLRQRPGWPRSTSASGKPKTPWLRPSLPASGQCMNSTMRKIT